MVLSTRFYVGITTCDRLGNKVSGYLVYQRTKYSSGYELGADKQRLSTRTNYKAASVLGVFAADLAAVNC